MMRHVTQFTDALNRERQNGDLISEETVNRAFAAVSDPIASDATMEDPEAYRLYKLCACEQCGGTGKADYDDLGVGVLTTRRCKSCRGEGKSLTLLATCGSKEAVGVAIVTLGAEGEWDECPFGLMHRPECEKGKWLVLPWLPSPRNVSDAGRTLAKSRRR